MASTSKSKPRPLGAKLHVQTPRKNSFISVPRFGHSPPNRDPGPAQVEEIKKGSLSQEFQKLQNELDVYIQKVEELANRGTSQKLFFGTSASCNDHSFSSEFIIGIKTVPVPEEPLDPEEQQKLETRRHKQAAHSARIVYVLQLKVGLYVKYMWMALCQ